MRDREALKIKMGHIQKLLTEAAMLSQRITHDDPNFRATNIRLKNMASDCKVVTHKIHMSSGGGWV